MVTIGLHDVIVVDTPEALLVCSGERSQEVRQIAEEAAASGRESVAKEKES